VVARPLPNSQPTALEPVLPEYFSIHEPSLSNKLLVNVAKTRQSHVAQSCDSVIGDKPFLWSKPKFDPP